nr:retrovirus-related Pol polyprotein from transposon TNT 1-94 [Tanacetum cinerariifolium]
MKRLNQHSHDPLALVSNVSPYLHPSSLSVPPQPSYIPPNIYQPQFTDNTQLDIGFSPADELLDNLTKQGCGSECSGDRTGFKETMLGVLLLQEIGELRTELNSDYFKEKMLLKQAQENGVDLDEEQLLFLAGRQTNTFDDEVDEGPVQDMAQNEDNIFQADQSGPSYDSDTLSEIQDHDNCLDNINESHKEHDMNNDDKEDHVVHSDVSFVPNDAMTIITNDIYEQDA